MPDPSSKVERTMAATTLFDILHPRLTLFTTTLRPLFVTNYRLFTTETSRDPDLYLYAIWICISELSPFSYLESHLEITSKGEELFYRAAVQGALADVFVRGNDLVANAHGMDAPTGILPPFVPFAQAFAVVITSALTGSLYYVAASPKDPTYVVAPVLSSHSGRQEMKKLFAEQMHQRESEANAHDEARESVAAKEE
ncbi:hypothetical protein Tco_1368523 [Tanacetum coccineum]